MIRKFIYSLGIIALMGALLTPRVEAGPVTLRLTSGLGATITVADGSVNDFNPLAGAVTWIGSLDNWFLNVSTGISDNPIPHMDLNTVNQSTGAGTLVIELSDTGFPVFPTDGNLTGLIGGTTDGTVDVFGYKANTNNLFDETNSIAQIQMGTFGDQLPGGVAFSGTAASFHGPVNFVHSMTQRVVIEHFGDGRTSFDYELRNLPVPVPAGIVLLGMGAPLLGAGYWMRRRRVAVT